MNDTKNDGHRSTDCKYSKKTRLMQRGGQVMQNFLKKSSSV